MRNRKVQLSTANFIIIIIIVCNFIIMILYIIITIIKVIITLVYLSS